MVMDTALMAGMLGTLVGGAATVTTHWITQKAVNKRELIRAEIGKREALYGEFIVECSKLLMDALTHTLDRPETLLPAYALLNRIRVSASLGVLAEAERLLMRITEIAELMIKREHMSANDAYLKLSIGNAPWPIGVTMVG